jgi:multidrug resistance efflux pump
LDLDTWTSKRDVAAAAIAESKVVLDDARWQLGETTVTGPFRGHVMNLQLRPRNVVSSLPAASPMAFISEETNSVLASFSQNAIRKIAVGDGAEVVFAHIPGEVFAGQVIRVVPTSSEAQLTASGQLPSFTGAPATDRWGVMIELVEPGDERLAGIPDFPLRDDELLITGSAVSRSPPFKPRCDSGPGKLPE